MQINQPEPTLTDRVIELIGNSLKQRPELLPQFKVSRFVYDTVVRAVEKIYTDSASGFERACKLFKFKETTGMDTKRYFWRGNQIPAHQITILYAYRIAGQMVDPSEIYFDDQVVVKRCEGCGTPCPHAKSCTIPGQRETILCSNCISHDEFHKAHTTPIRRCSECSYSLCDHHESNKPKVGIPLGS